MKTITEKTVEKVVREALSEERLKKIAVWAMEDYVLASHMKEGEMTPLGEYSAVRAMVKEKLT